MAIRTYKLGPGTLVLNPGVAGTFDCSTQLKNCRVEWSEQVETEDAIPVLSGEEIPAEETATYTAKLAGNVLQDLEEAGLVNYTWENMGTEVPFEFQPRSDVARSVTGTLRIGPLNLGGDVKSRPESDFSWSIIGEPVYAPAAP